MTVASNAAAQPSSRRVHGPLVMPFANVRHAAMLDGAFERSQRLRPEAVLPPVPEEPGAAIGAGDRHGAAAGGAYAGSERRPILEILCRQVARRARHLAVRAEARVQEDALPEARGVFVRCIPVASVGGARAFHEP